MTASHKVHPLGLVVKIFGFQPTMDARAKKIAHTNANDALGAFMSKYSVAIWQRLGNGEYIGSGTCIEIDGRLFVATAAHNFQDISKGGTVALVPALDGSSRTPLRQIAIGVADTPDVAWVEIDKQSATARKLEGISLDVITPRHKMKVDQSYEVTGFPSELGEKVTLLDTKFWLIIYNTKASARAKPGEVLLDYAEEAYRQLRGSDERVLTPLPHPGGISGGGIWYIPTVATTQLWSPSRCRLIGVATTYFKTRREIGGLHMQHWLKFLLKDHPELQSSIKAALNRRCR